MKIDRVCKNDLAVKHGCDEEIAVNKALPRMGAVETMIEPDVAERSTQLFCSSSIVRRFTSEAESTG